MYAGANGSSTPRKKERKVSILCRHTDSEHHCAAVEGLAAAPDGSWLYTGSRDSTVKRWDLTAGRPAAVRRYEGHVDWVNDIAVVGPRLVSASSDRTVRVWDATLERGAGEAAGGAAGGAAPAGRCLHTFQTHSDYVTCLASAPARGLVASAGLRGEIVLYDLAAGEALSLQPPATAAGGAGADATAARGGAGASDAAARGGAAGVASPSQAAAAAAAAGTQQAAAAAGDAKGSIYAVAVTGAGTLLAAGCAEAFVRLYDLRSGRKVMKLRGHQDNVRCLAFSADGGMLLSGSSDHTVRLWDLGTQRCVQTVAVHTDSVWSVAPTPDFSAVYSGGRDGCVYRTHLGARSTQLLLRQEGPVRRVALAHEAGRLWVCGGAACGGASVSGYDVPREGGGDVSGGGGAVGAAAAAATSAVAADGDRGGGSGDGVSERSRRPSASGNSSSLPRSSLLGTSPALRLRHSADAAPAAPTPELASPAATIPGAPGVVAHRVLPDRRHVLTRDSDGAVALWDVLRARVVERYPRGADMAEREAALWAPVAVPAWFTADTKLGCLALHLEPPGCFSAEAYAQDLGITTAPDDAKVNLGATLLRAVLRGWATKYAARFLSGAPLPGMEEWGDAAPRYSDALPPAVISARADGVHWRRLASEFTGLEREGEDVPRWAAEALLRGVMPAVKDLKAAFVLHPAEGSGLPSLLQSRLNAPRILQVAKVANYCATKLSELNVPFATHAVGWTAEGQVPPTAREQQVLELTCNGLAVPYAMSVASVQKFLWKRSDDVVFHYRVLDPARPAPLPAFKPPR